MYIETSAPRRVGDKARLISPTYPPTSGRCLNFAYHMFGRGIGTLNIYLKQQGQLRSPIWTRAGNLGNRWNIGQTNVNSNTPFQVS